MAEEKNIYIFHRKEGFYPLELESDKEAAENAIHNPGTLFVKKVSVDKKKPSLEYVFISPEYFELKTKELEKEKEYAIKQIGHAKKKLDSLIQANELDTPLRRDFIYVHDTIVSILNEFSGENRERQKRRDIFFATGVYPE